MAVATKPTRSLTPSCSITRPNAMSGPHESQKRGSAPRLMQPTQGIASDQVLFGLFSILNVNSLRVSRAGDVARVQRLTGRGGGSTGGRRAATSPHRPGMGEQHLLL
jgi:hypothetical protein